MSDKRIVSVQALRFLAAFGVMLNHTEIIAFNLGRFLDVDVGRPAWLSSGAFRVDLFFAISGFIIVIASERLFGSANGRFHFAARRLIRVVPLYWAATFVTLAWGLRFGPRPDLASALNGLAFIPYPSNTAGGRIVPPLEVGWTLNYEMLFYTLFAACFAASARATVNRLLVAISALVAIGTLVSLPMPLAAWTKPILLQFCGGMIIARMHSASIRLSAAARVMMLLMAGALFALSVDGLEDGQAGWDRLLTRGVGSWLILGAAVLGPLRLPAGRAWNFGGDISYAIYLVHMPVLLAAQLVWRHFRWPYGSLIEACFIAGMIALTLVTATIVHFCFERPLNRWLRARLDRAAQT